MFGIDMVVSLGVVGSFVVWANCFVRRCSIFSTVEISENSNREFSEKQVKQIELAFVILTVLMIIGCSLSTIDYMPAIVPGIVIVGTPWFVISLIYFITRYKLTFGKNSLIKDLTEEKAFLKKQVKRILVITALLGIIATSIHFGFEIYKNFRIEQVKSRVLEQANGE